MISLGHVKKRLHKKVKTKSKIHDFITWETSNYNAHVAQHLRQQRPSNNEIWAVNRI